MAKCVWSKFFFFFCYMSNKQKLEILFYDFNNSFPFRNGMKTANQVHFSNVNISDIHYDVQIKAYSPGGVAESELYVNIQKVHPNSYGKILLLWEL